MTLTLTISLDNAAFHDDRDEEGEPTEQASGAEVSRILRVLSKSLAEETIEAGDRWPLIDVNGNRVGAAVVTE